MSNVLIFSALACALQGEGAPSEFVFLPEGEHKLTPQSHPKGITVKMPADKGAQVAAAFNEALAKRENVTAWCDFEHSRKYPVSCYPTSFRYVPGQGVVATVEWSKSGREAVEGRDARFFSPEFYIGDDGVPTGLPDRGPVGALCTEPAFREIPAITAADADADKPTESQQTMSSLIILAALGIDHSRSDADQAGLTKLQEIQAAAARVPGLEGEVTKLKGEVKDGKQKAGLALFKRAVTAGLEKADDAERKARYLSAAEADDSFALELLTEKVAAAEAGKGDDDDDITKPIVTARDSGGAKNNEQRISAAQTKARNELGPGANFSEVWARAAEIDPPAFV
ncbi:phage protease [Luteolibacter flavescens]|uniref:Phage protease n=1 Tax=Luteolibacter flavescens TaxID=1859460 RepID=A0ABT3FVU0_9BACT|nr:phage protease [Luteolibacter flavescens]MCW1887711.1 phage protease [Luteolibacter flavescens]